MTIDDNKKTHQIVNQHKLIHKTYQLAGIEQIYIKNHKSPKTKPFKEDRYLAPHVL